jgi:uncharacterized surface protein with fasciclin (FAS1) repeats
MKNNISRMKVLSLLALAFTITFVSCNKEPEEIIDNTVITPPVSNLTLAETLDNNADDSLYYRLVVHGGQVPVISNDSSSYTLFVPNNNAMRVFINAISGGLVPINAPDAVFSGFITNNIPQTTAGAIVGYNIIPQIVRAAQIPGTFPNLQYPTIINPAPSVSALLRLTTFPTTRNGAWVNNIPITAVDQEAVNGVIHHTAFLVTPPQRFLWDRINTDTDLEYLKAAIARADSGTAAPGFLVGVLNNIGANLTVFAPTDAAFQGTLTLAIAQILINLGVPPATALAQAQALASTPAIFSNPNLYPFLTAQTVKGIVVYHILGKRAFTNNLPTTLTNYPTLLNGAIPAHPGLGIQATFGVPFVSGATVKGLANPTAANIIINASPLIPDPSGSSDQHYLNGVIHKIDQVLLPQ